MRRTGLTAAVIAVLLAGLPYLSYAQRPLSIETLQTYGIGRGRDQLTESDIIAPFGPQVGQLGGRAGIHESLRGQWVEVADDWSIRERISYPFGDWTLGYEINDESDYVTARHASSLDIATADFQTCVQIRAVDIEGLQEWFGYVIVGDTVFLEAANGIVATGILPGLIGPPERLLRGGEAIEALYTARVETGVDVRLSPDGFLLLDGVPVTRSFRRFRAYFSQRGTYPPNVGPAADIETSLDSFRNLFFANRTPDGVTIWWAGEGVRVVFAPNGALFDYAAVPQEPRLGMPYAAVNGDMYYFGFSDGGSRAALRYVPYSETLAQYGYGGSSSSRTNRTSSETGAVIRPPSVAGAIWPGSLDLPVLSSPAVGSRVVAEIPSGTSVEVLWTSDQSSRLGALVGAWCCIETEDGSTGWILGSFLERD